MQSVHNISGHSSATARAEYILAEREDDIINTRAIFDNNITATTDDFDLEFDDDIFNDELPLLSADPAEDEPTMKWAEWGAKHPDIHRKDCGKVNWSDKERSYIGKFCNDMQRSHPYCKTLMAKCRVAILSDPVARELFHPHHLSRNDRLRAGYQSYLRAKNK